MPRLRGACRGLKRHSNGRSETDADNLHMLAYRDLTIDRFLVGLRGARDQYHVAGIDDFEVAEAAYRAAVARWPAARITLRQGARVVMRNWRNGYKSPLREWS